MTTKSAINFRTTYVLIGAAAVLLAALAIYVFVSDDAKPNPQGILLESFHSIGAKSTEITGVEIDRAGAKIVFSRQQDGRWSLVEPVKARADSDLVENMVHQILTAKREEKNVDIVDNLGAHGLDQPSVKITLRRGERAATLSLGKVSVGGDQAVVYVLTSDQPKKAQATLKKRLAALFKEKAPGDADAAAMIRDLDDFRTRKLLGEGIQIEAASTRLNGVRLTVGKKVLYLSRNNPEKIWRFAEPPGYGDVEMLKPDDKNYNPARFQYLGHLLNVILTVEVSSLKDFVAGPPDLTALGLDPSNPDVLRVDLERADEIGTETLWLSRINAKGERDKVYVRYGNEDSVALVNGEKPRLLWNLVQDPTDLRDLTLVKFRSERVDAVDIVQGGKKAFELRKVAGKWKVYDGDKVNDANPSAINELLGLLTQPRGVRGFPVSGSKDDVLGLDKPVVELRIWEDGINKADKEELNTRPKVRETPTTRVLFGKKDVGDMVFVRRFIGGGVADAKLSESVLGLAQRGRLDYLALTMKPFAEADVSRLIIPRGNEIYEIERAEAGRWRITAPETKKGKYANPDKIHNLIQALAVMQPQKVVAETPSPDQIKALGLDPQKPVQQIGLKINGEMADRVWYFGNPVGKSDSVYAKTNQSEFVFEVSKQFAEIVGTGELIDPHLFQIAVAEVEGMKLKGWSELSAKAVPQEVSLKRKPGGVWEAPGKDAVVSSEKMEAFLAAIRNPRAETIVLEKGKPAEHHGLDVNQGALEITLDLGGGKKLILTLGNMVTKESKLIYAMVNDEIVTIKADPLVLEVKAKPAALR